MGDNKHFYKLTEFDEIPEKWKLVTLEETIDEIKNGFASGKRDEKGIVQIRMNNVTTNGRLIFDSYLKVPTPENTDFWLLKKGDLLFNNTNSIDLVGKSAIFNDAPFPCTFSNHFTRIRFKKELVLPELILYHFLILWEKSYFKSVAIRHVGQSAVHTDYLLKLQIPLPPLPEQRRIAEVLGTVDSAIQKVGGAIEKTERLKKGLMQRLLTRGIGHERFKFSKELGCEIPEEWEVMTLGRATEIIMGQSPPGDTYNTAMNGILLINGPAEFGEKYPKPNKWTSEPTKITKKNDVLICVRGHTTGRLNISDKELCIGRGVAAIRNLPDATNNIFLYYILDWMRNKIFGISYAAGSTFPNITSGQLNKLNIPLPPLPEQRRIAEILSAADRKLELERRRKEKLERVKNGMMNELLTGRKRVTVENDGSIYK